MIRDNSNLLYRGYGQTETVGSRRDVRSKKCGEDKKGSVNVSLPLSL